MIPFVGPSSALPADRVDLQRAINCYPVSTEKAGATVPAYMAPAPGLVVFSTPGPPAPAVVFRDTFTGTNGTLITAHVPDIKPAGFAYAADDPDVPRLLGGHLVPEDDETESVQGASSAPFTLTPTVPFQVTLIARPDSAHDNESFVQLTDSDSGASVRLSVGRFDGVANYQSTAEADNGTDSPVSAESAITGVAAEHRVDLLVQATQVSIRFDGGTPTVIPYASGTPSFDTFKLEMNASDGDGGAYIDLIEVAEQ